MKGRQSILNSAGLFLIPHFREGEENGMRLSVNLVSMTRRKVLMHPGNALPLLLGDASDRPQLEHYKSRM